MVQMAQLAIGQQVTTWSELLIMKWFTQSTKSHEIEHVNSISSLDTNEIHKQEKKA